MKTQAWNGGGVWYLQNGRTSYDDGGGDADVDDDIHEYCCSMFTGTTFWQEVEKRNANKIVGSF